MDIHFTAWHQQVWKPVITAVNGICAGGGFHWVADADIVIAAFDATFFDPHVSIGQVVAIEAIGLIRKMPVRPSCGWLSLDDMSESTLTGHTSWE